jgi:hypothetical protein
MSPLTKRPVRPVRVTSLSANFDCRSNGFMQAHCVRINHGTTAPTGKSVAVQIDDICRQNPMPFLLSEPVRLR